METTFAQRVKIVMEAEGFKDNPKSFADFLGMKRPDVLYNVINKSGDKATGFSQTLFDFITKKIQTIDRVWLERGVGNSPIEKPEMIILDKDYETIRLKWEATRNENTGLLKEKIAHFDRVKELEGKIEFLEAEVRRLRQILRDNNIAV